MITLSAADLFAVTLALFSSLTILIVAFRRIAVLEAQVLRHRREFFSTQTFSAGGRQ